MRIRSTFRYRVVNFFVIVGIVLAPFAMNPASVSAAACTLPTTDYGTVTSNATSQISIPSTGTYRVWSRMQIPTSTSNSYLLEIDGTTCYTVGGNTSMATNTWTWVDYQGGNTTNKINATLSAGNHSYKLIGNADGVLLDRLIFTQDTTAGSSCNPPIGTGDPCANPVNVPPTVSLTASATTGTAPLSTTLTATPADSDGTITKVEFFSGSTSLGSKTAAPWTQAVTGLAAGTYTYTVKATDNDGAVTTSSAVTVTVNNPTTQKPGDANNDGAVNSSDLAIFSFNWGKTGMTFAQGDFNADGTVNSNDLAILSFNWGK